MYWRGTRQTPGRQNERRAKEEEINSDMTDVLKEALPRLREFESTKDVIQIGR